MSQAAASAQPLAQGAATEPSASLFRTTGLLGVAMAVTRLCNLGVVATLARGAGTSAVGLYGLATLAASFIALAGSLGFSTYSTRERASGLMTDNEVGAVHCGRLVVASTATVLVYTIASRVLSPLDAIGFTGFAGAVLLDQWNETAWALIRGTRRAYQEALTNGVTYGALLLVALLLLSQDRLSFFSAGVAAYSIAALRSATACATVRVPWPRSLRTIEAAVRRHIRRALPYMASDVFGLAYLRGDTLVLALFVSTSELGEYVAANAFTAPLVQIASAMSLGALATSASRRIGGDGSELAVTQFFSRSGLAVGSALVASLALTVRALYGQGHGAIIALASILAMFIPLRFFNFGLSSILLARGMAVRRLKIVLFGLGSNVVLNLVLDPFAHARGAAWATVITEVGVSAALLVALGERRLRREGAFLGLAVGLACLPLLVTSGLLARPGPAFVSAIVLAGFCAISFLVNGRPHRLHEVPT